MITTGARDIDSSKKKTFTYNNGNGGYGFNVGAVGGWVPDGQQHYDSVGVGGEQGGHIDFSMRFER